MSSGRDVVISGAMYEDAEVATMLTGVGALTVETFDTTLKGFGDAHFRLWRIYSQPDEQQEQQVMLPPMAVRHTLSV